MNKEIEARSPESAQNNLTNAQNLGNRHELFRDAIILLLFTLLIRLPYFVPTVVHWHESTYTLLGQDILDGHLPQTFYSELKPPAAGIPYALFILLFGKAIAAIRTGGALCIWFASVVLNQACCKHFGRLSALLAAVSLIIFTTTDDRAGCTMLEHIALVPLALMVFLVARREWTTNTFFQLGLVIGLAALLKTNLAFFALAPLVMAVCKWKAFTWSGVYKRFLVLAAGVGIPQLIVFAIYWFTGNINLLIHSSILATFASASYQRAQFMQRIPEVLQQLKSANPGAVFLCWILPFFNLLRILKTSTPQNAETAKKRELLVAMALCVVFGFVTMLIPGVIHARRYYIALVPFTSCMAASSFQYFMTQSKKSLSIILTCAFSLSLMPVAQAYNTAWMFITGKRTDEALEIARYLAAHSVKNRYVYFQTAHIGYWLTGATSPTRFIHPTNMSKSELLATLYERPSSATQELDEIFEKQPLYVVAPLRSSESAESEFTKGLDRKLKEDYALVKMVGNIGIFEINRD
ncbi:MAG TPA: hypothetical protein V6C97_36225 [Oculatellaceae cyanobacterium]